MLFDLHIHQNRHSKDSHLDIYQAIEEAKTLGLSGVAITDHDDLGLRLDQARLSKETGLMVFVGVEINTLDGDLLCYGIDEIPNERLSAEETIAYVHKRGGVCIAAHPYRHNNRGLSRLIETIEGLDAIEAYNGRTDDFSNAKALEVAHLRNIPATGSSDAHEIGEVGRFVTRFTQEINNEVDFIEALKSGLYIPDIVRKQSKKTA